MDQAQASMSPSTGTKKRDFGAMEGSSHHPSTKASRNDQRVSRGDARGSRRSRGARGGRNKKSDIGRAEWSRTTSDKRARHVESQQAVKRQRLVGEKPVLPIYATQFTKEEIESEPKRPKRKVAVMMGYSGSGYKGMQLNYNERTIEGDLFKAFVGAGAISKANADDPKKSGLIRCARTDKGVHAAGNIVSLKLIVEDPEVVSKINEKLSSQIRVFGIERTNGSFSAYQFCDSRIYEYLVPTHCFLPPHPSSYLGRRLDELAKKADDEQGYKERQEEVSSFWAETEKNQIQPILERIDPSIRSLVQRALYEISVKEAEEEFAKTTRSEIKVGGVTTLEVESLSSIDHNHASTETAGGNEPTEPQTRVAESDALAQQKSGDKSPKATVTEIDEQGTLVNSEEQTLISQKTTDTSNAGAKISDIAEQTDEESAGLRLKQLSTLEFAIRELRSAYISAKKAYRIHPQRLERVRSTLSRYVGTQNFHNYTIDKGFRDASAKRVIKSFIVALDPIIIGDTEWLSLKVHGQSFMMHQIRKMVSMAALVIRCGCHEGRVQDSYMADNLSIPKAPGLGLLLERPVFDTYNERLVGQYEREPIEFKKYEKEMEDFKQREIYERIFREEENNNTFHSFFAAIDNLKSSRLLYLSSMGIVAAKDEYAPGTPLSAGADAITLIGSDSDEEGTIADDDGGSV